jgi:hypothetical protein
LDFGSWPLPPPSTWSPYSGRVAPETLLDCLVENTSLVELPKQRRRTTNRIGKGSRPLFTRRRRCGISAVLTRHNRFENSTARIGPRKRRLDRKSFSVNCTMNPGRWPISGTYLTSAGCLAIWLGFASDFPGNPELRLVLSQGLRIQTWGIHSWCLIEMMATRPLRVVP